MFTTLPFWFSFRCKEGEPGCVGICDMKKQINQSAQAASKALLELTHQITP
jgi:hypothetical protein